MLNLSFDQPIHKLAADLRRAFSGIVAGNVKQPGIIEIKKHGPFKIHGSQEIIEPLEALLTSMVEQQRMKLPGSKYVPCYEIVN